MNLLARNAKGTTLKEMQDVLLFARQDSPLRPVDTRARKLGYTKTVLTVDDVKKVAGKWTMDFATVYKTLCKELMT